MSEAASAVDPSNTAVTALLVGTVTRRKGVLELIEELRRSPPAPLREDLARALLIASGWTPERSLLDPLMGAGTVVIEAATMARRMAPGMGRRFAFEHTKLAAFAALQEQREAAQAAVLPALSTHIVGRDHLAGAVEAAHGNAERAGVVDDVTLSCAELQEPWPELGAAHIVTNPPYGIRIGEASGVHTLYAAVGELIRASGWPFGIVIADRRFVRSLGLSLQPKLTTDHGGIKVAYYAG